MISVLFNASELANKLGRDIWDFAEEITGLWPLGVSNGELRALMLQGFLAHAQETSTAQSSGRSFRKIDNLSLPERTCLVLTKAGEELARRLELPPVCRATTSWGLHTNGHSKQPDLQPTWDAELRELRVGEVLVKKFLRPAPNQEIILASFQKQRWKVRIDDPLPRLMARDARLCLHDTINHLNRNLLKPLIHFSGDGTGRGIRWRLTGTRLAVR